MMVTVAMMGTVMEVTLDQLDDQNLLQDPLHQGTDSWTQTKVSPQGYPPLTNSTHPRC